MMTKGTKQQIIAVGITTLPLWLLIGYIVWNVVPLIDSLLSGK